MKRKTKFLKKLEEFKKVQPPNFWRVDRRIKSAMEKVDGVLQHAVSNTETLKYINTALKVEKRKTRDKKKDPWLKRQIQGKTKEARRDLSRLETLKEN